METALNSVFVQQNIVLDNSLYYDFVFLPRRMSLRETDIVMREGIKPADLLTF